MNKTLAITVIVMFAIIMGMSAISPAMAQGNAEDSSANCDPADNDNAKNEKNKGKFDDTPSRGEC